MTFEITPVKQANYFTQRAREKALERHKELLAERQTKYYENPKLCKTCKTIIPYKKAGDNKYFCSHSCSAISSNASRPPMTTAQKQKISKALTGHPNPYKGVVKKNYCRIEFRNCTVCNKLFYVKEKKNSGLSPRKNCSRECSVISTFKNRKYQNGSRKTTKIVNPFEQKEVLLESSWEVAVAEKLNEMNIHWTRPDPLPWIDGKGETHMYYPDFYLPEFDVYLDPKNPWCMKKDSEKMDFVSTQIVVCYGSLDIINEFIDACDNEIRRI